MGLLHNCWSRGGREAKDKWRIDAWIIGWLVIDFAILMFLLPQYPFLVVFPIARLSDLMYVLVRLFLLSNGVFKRGRALLFLLVHYLEVVTIFGCFYIFLQQMSGAKIFMVGNQPDSMGIQAGCLSPAQAFYFSFTTAATVGFGDITPNLRVEAWWARPSNFVVLELLCIVVIIALDVAHIFSRDEATTNKSGQVSAGN